MSLRILFRLWFIRCFDSDRLLDSNVYLFSVYFTIFIVIVVVLYYTTNITEKCLSQITIKWRSGGVDEETRISMILHLFVGCLCIWDYLKCILITTTTEKGQYKIRVHVFNLIFSCFLVPANIYLIKKHRTHRTDHNHIYEINMNWFDLNKS